MSGYGWLDAAVKGDTVIIWHARGEGRSVGIITRTTKTRIMVRVGPYNIETAFRRTDGHEVGGGMWGSYSITEGKPEDIQATTDETRRLKLASELNHRNWRNCSLATLEAVATILAKKVANSGTTPEVRGEA